MRARAPRIGVDLDSPAEWVLLKTYLNATGFFPHSRVEIKRTGHGFHIRIFETCEDIEKNLDVRRNLGDDPNRLMFDEYRKLVPQLHDWVDTCFMWKIQKGKLTWEEPCNVLALPFNDRFPARKGKI